MPQCQTKSADTPEYNTSSKCRSKYIVFAVWHVLKCAHRACFSAAFSSKYETMKVPDYTAFAAMSACAKSDVQPDSLQ